MERFLVAGAVVVLISRLASAGVVVETEVRVPEAAEPVGTERFTAQGEMVRMDPYASSPDGDMSLIFRDQTMWFVDHKKKVSQRIDKQGVDALSAQLDQMMKQLDQLPPEQREMMMKAMQGKIPGAEPPELRVETGATEQVGPYTCTVHTLYSDGDKVSEVCAADESIGKDVFQAMDAFRAMSRFTDELQRVARKGPMAEMVRLPLFRAQEIEGFPVRTRSFDGDGEIVRESTLLSITVEEIDPATFAVPEGYKVKDLSKELKKGR